MSRSFLIAFVLFLLFITSDAQQFNGEISGKITDEDEISIPGVNVTLEAADIAPMSTITSETGVYRFRFLPPGTYSIRIELAGFKTETKENIVIQVGEKKNVDFLLTMSALEEEVTVIAAEPTISPSMKFESKPTISKPFEIESSFFNKEIEEEIEHLSIGKILFNPPEEMIEHIKERVEVRISQNLVEDLAQGLKGRGIPHIETINISSVMTADLSGDTFKIKSLSKTEQPVFPSEYAQWEWDVTPQKAGQRILQLSISASIYLDRFGEKKKSLPVMEKEIFVKVNPEARISSFFKRDLLKILTIIGAILGICLSFKKIQVARKRRKEKTEKT